MYLNKNDYLEEFKNFLLKTVPNKNTRKNYMTEIKNAFQNQEFSDIKTFDYEKLDRYINKLDDKRNVSCLKQSLLRFEKKFNDFCTNEYLLTKKVKETRKKKRKNWDSLKLSTVEKKINSMSNKKFQLAFKMAEFAGLRIEELSNVQKQDISFDKNGNLIVFVNNGKGGKSASVKAIKDDYFNCELIKYTETVKDTDKLFYSDSYMSKCARKNNFRTHDLRRIGSQIVYENKDYTKREAIQKVREFLRHGQHNIYKKYISRKIDKTATRYK